MMDWIITRLKSITDETKLFHFVLGSILGLVFRCILGVLLPHLFAVIGAVGIIGALGAWKENDNPKTGNLRWTLMGGFIGAL